MGGIKLDPATTHHDLPDVFVEFFSNCCGSGDTGYRFDGKEYQEATGRLEATLAGQLLNDVAAPGIPGVQASSGCVLKEGSFWSDSDNPGLKIVASLCDDEAQNVWLIKTTGVDKEASVEILAREELLGDSVIVTSEKQAQTTDVIFPHSAPGAVTWHLGKNKFTRDPPSAASASGSTSALGSPAEVGSSK